MEEQAVLFALVDLDFHLLLSDSVSLINYDIQSLNILTSVQFLELFLTLHLRIPRLKFYKPSNTLK